MEGGGLRPGPPTGDEHRAFPCPGSPGDSLPLFFYLKYHMLKGVTETCMQVIKSNSETAPLPRAKVSNRVSETLRRHALSWTLSDL